MLRSTQDKFITLVERFLKICENQSSIKKPLGMIPTLDFNKDSQ